MGTAQTTNNFNYRPATNTPNGYSNTQVNMFNYQSNMNNSGQVNSNNE